MAGLDAGVVAGLMLLGVPTGLALVTLGFMDKFRQETFGLFQQAMNTAMIGVCLGLAFWMTLVVGFWTSGRTDAMVEFPLSSEGWIMYAQLFAATVTLIVVQRSAKYLWQAVSPKAH